MDEWRFYLLAPPRLVRNDASIALPRRKQWGLLTYLLLTRQSHERDTLATLLWPQASQQRARASLRRELARLRSLLPGLLQNSHTQVALSAAAVWVDVWAFAAHLAAVRAHDHAHASDAYCAACLDHLEAAHALYADDLLAGFALRDSPEFEEWHFFQQESLRGELLEVLDRRVRMEMAGADPEQAISPLRERLARDPLHEESHRRLIWLYAHTGQRAAALRQFRICRDALATELGVAPMPETVALYRQIAQAEPVPRHAEPVHTGGSSPPLAAPAHLFLDRERHLAQLNAHLAAACSGAGRIVFVTGAAGSGKTALLDHFARQALAQRGDLIVAGGCGTAPYGADASLLPFRDIFAMLAGECEWAENMPSDEQMNRLRALLPYLVAALLQAGPHLVDSLVAGEPLLARAAEFYLDRTEDYEHLRGLVTSHHGRVAEPAAYDLILPEIGAVLHALALRQPLLLLIDNLQWADDLTFDLLFHLGKRVGAQPMLLVGAYRPDEIVPGFANGALRDGLSVHHPLVALTHEFTRDFGAIQVDLDDVTPAENLAWLDALLAAQACRLSPLRRGMLFAQTRGHPLFSIELLQLWRARGWLRRNGAGYWVEAGMPELNALPLKAAAAIQRRLDRLSADAARLLAVASVEGEIFTARAVAAVLGWSERRTLELLAAELHHDHHLVAEVAELAADAPTQYRFTNPMICTYLYNQLDRGERHLLHDAFEQVLYAANPAAGCHAIPSGAMPDGTANNENP